MKEADVVYSEDVQAACKEKVGMHRWYIVRWQNEYGTWRLFAAGSSPPSKTHLPRQRRARRAGHDVFRLCAGAERHALVPREQGVAMDL